MSREARSITAKPRETKRCQPLPEGAFHRAGSAAAFTAANAAAETGTDERPLIAVSAGNFNTVFASTAGSLAPPAVKVVFNTILQQSE